ncbi:hypothetical protein FKM82_007399 [Ascaphus truei]
MLVELFFYMEYTRLYSELATLFLDICVFYEMFCNLSHIALNWGLDFHVADFGDLYTFEYITFLLYTFNLLLSLFRNGLLQGPL